MRLPSCCRDVAVRLFCALFSVVLYYFLAACVVSKDWSRVFSPLLPFLCVFFLFLCRYRFYYAMMDDDESGN